MVARRNAWATAEELTLPEQLGNTRLREIPVTTPQLGYWSLSPNSSGTNADFGFPTNRAVYVFEGKGISVGRRIEPQLNATAIAHTFVWHGRSLDLTADHFPGVAGRSSENLPLERVSAYQNRIEYLRADGKKDEVDINPSSEDDFWNFVNLVPDWQQGSLVLGDDGSLRVVWRGENGDRVNVEFLGNDQVELAIFEGGHIPDEYPRLTVIDALKDVQQRGMAPV